MPLPNGEEALKAVFTELETQTDRGVAIIAVAMLELYLTEAIEKRLILTKELQTSLFNFEKQGPLATMNAKINMAFAIGLLRDEVRRELHIMRKIRNRFAHEVLPLEFTDTRISNWCAALPIDKEITAPRNRFLSGFLLQMLALIVICNLDVKLVPLREQPGMAKQIDDVVDKLFAFVEKEGIDPAQ